MNAGGEGGRGAADINAGAIREAGDDDVTNVQPHTNKALHFPWLDSTNQYSSFPL